MVVTNWKWEDCDVQAFCLLWSCDPWELRTAPGWTKMKRKWKTSWRGSIKNPTKKGTPFMPMIWKTAPFCSICYWIFDGLLSRGIIAWPCWTSVEMQFCKQQMQGLDWSTQHVTQQMDAMGDLLICHMEPAKEPVWDERTTLVTRAYMKATKRASDHSRTMTEDRRCRFGLLRGFFP